MTAMVSIGVALVPGGPKGSLRLVTVEEWHVLTVYMGALGPFWLQLPTMWQKETVIKIQIGLFFFYRLVYNKQVSLLLAKNMDFIK